jgi:thiamine-phosphate pyrophosphorylase
MVNLPALLVLTDRRQSRRPLPETVAAAVSGGARVVVLREKDLPDTEREALAARLWHTLAPVGGLLIAASRPVAPAVGLHLAATDPPTRAGIVGRSCHDLSEVDRATAERADYLTVSPVFPTASKPGYGPPLGLDGLAALCRRTTVGVYALGGVTAGTVAACRSVGAAGVAVMGQVMRADDPARTVADILRCVEMADTGGGR